MIRVANCFVPAWCLACWLAAADVVRAVDVADFEDGAAPAGGWENTTLMPLPKCDSNGLFQVYRTRIVFVSTILIDTHCKTKAGRKLPHFHFQSEYDSIPDADRYWDKRFGASDSPPKTERPWSATVKQNCYTWALELVANGTYTYPIDQHHGGQVYDALVDDCELKDKSSVEWGDVMWYWAKDHASPVTETVLKCDGSKQVKRTTFKWSVGGYYRCYNGGFNTPYKEGNDPKEGDPLPEWQWNPNFATDADFYPAGKVWRKKT
jgi:hypothetical protein